jgi:hypothetical protein
VRREDERGREAPAIRSGPWGPRSILCILQPKPESLRALAWAIGLARTSAADLTVVYHHRDRPGWTPTDLPYACVTPFGWVANLPDDRDFVTELNEFVHVAGVPLTLKPIPSTGSRCIAQLVSGPTPDLIVASFAPRRRARRLRRAGQQPPWVTII